MNALAIFAILFLLGLGFVAYAVPGSAISGSPADGPSDGQSGSPAGAPLSNGLSFALVPTPTYSTRRPPLTTPSRRGEPS